MNLIKKIINLGRRFWVTLFKKRFVKIPYFIWYFIRSSYCFIIEYNLMGLTLHSIKFFKIDERFSGIFTFFIPLTPASDAYASRNIIIYFFEISFIFIIKTLIFLSWKVFFPINFKVVSNSFLCFCSLLAQVLENFTVNLWIWYLRNSHLIRESLESSLSFFIFWMCCFNFSLKMLWDSNELLNFQNPGPLLFCFSLRRKLTLVNGH